MITLDCAEVRPLADFWSALLAWDVRVVQDEYAMLVGPGVSLGLGWVPDHQPGETWRVLLDPAGHPFCLTDAANWD